MKSRDRKIWSEQRKQGKKTYILKEFVLPIMLLVTFLAFIINIADLFLGENYTLADFNSYGNLVKLLICMTLGLLVGFPYGWFHWRLNENEYKINLQANENKQNSVKPLNL